MQLSLVILLENENGNTIKAEGFEFQTKEHALAFFKFIQNQAKQYSKKHSKTFTQI